LFSTPEPLSQQDEAAIQWDLFQKYHLGNWKGVWTTYDYIGDVMDETVASVDLNLVSDNLIQHVHTVVVGAKTSDCKTCFDSMQTKTMPIATYQPNNLRKIRLAANAMVNGPTLLKSGAMATELVLSFGDGRLRVLFQHAPVWEKGVEPGSGPPQALKLFRTMVSREALRPTSPTRETEAAARENGEDLNPVFYRPVPPFYWHKKWGGTSWTWGPQSGDRGWNVEQLEEMDAWHGETPVELWNLRLPGGVFVQSPRLITDAEVGLVRLAWLPNDEQTLLRVEAGILALQPMVLEDSSLAGFYPPALASLRADVFTNQGELENASLLARNQEETIKPQPDAEQRARPSQSPPSPAPSAATTTNGDDAKPRTTVASSDRNTSNPKTSTRQEDNDSVDDSPTSSAAASSESDDSDDDSNSGLQAIRDAIRL